MEFDVRKVDLGRLNSLTKYPSILTYHTLGERGILTQEVQIPFTGRVIGTEKVDGTNCRLIFCPDGSVLVGSREDLLWERRDLIGNPAMGIVETVRDDAIRWAPVLCQPDRIAVYYVEVYGRNIGAAAKNYSSTGKASVRLFDVALFTEFGDLLDWPTDKISAWRESGGQPFVDVESIKRAAAEIGLECVPPLIELDAAELPTSLEAMHEFLLRFEKSRCMLDDAAAGTPEGVVIRSPDRKSIAKIRREDYRRTLRRGNKK